MLGSRPTTSLVHRIAPCGNLPKLFNSLKKWFISLMYDLTFWTSGFRRICKSKWWPVNENTAAEDYDATPVVKSVKKPIKNNIRAPKKLEVYLDFLNSTLFFTL